jgi:hypothetical protein
MDFNMRTFGLRGRYGIRLRDCLLAKEFQNAKKERQEAATF